jgi:hypothetical protein
MQLGTAQHDTERLGLGQDRLACVKLNWYKRGVYQFVQSSAVHNGRPGVG